MKVTKWERGMYGICGLALVLLTLLAPEKNIALDLLFGGVGFIYLAYAIYAKGE